MQWAAVRTNKEVTSEPPQKCSTSEFFSDTWYGNSPSRAGTPLMILFDAGVSKPGTLQRILEINCNHLETKS